MVWGGAEAADGGGLVGVSRLHLLVGVSHLHLLLARLLHVQCSGVPASPWLQYSDVPASPWLQYSGVPASPWCSGVPASPWLLLHLHG